MAQARRRHPAFERWSKEAPTAILISDRSLDSIWPSAGGTSSNTTQRNAKAASVSMRGTFTRVTGVFTGGSAAAVAFHFR